MTGMTDRFYKSKWGVFNHFLGGDVNSAEEWNEKVNGFDVEKVAKQLHEMGASYYFLTIMQGKRFMCSPNSRYDEIGGIKPGEACSVRDLPMDMYNALSKYGIDLYLYYTGDGPHKDEVLNKKFGYWDPINNPVPESFVHKWALVLEEYAVRYGDKVKGWWMDGFYDYFYYNNDLMAPYYEAIKKGNPDALVSFNNGELVRQYEAEKEYKIDKWYEKAEFTAGEQVDFIHIPESRFANGAQTHMLIPMGIPLDPSNIGTSWCQPGLKRSPEHIIDFAKKAFENGVVLTFDIYVDKYGNFDESQKSVLKLLNTEK